MTRKTNLYHNLVINEDTLTELLANLLQFPEIKDIFTELLADKLGFDGFSFQYAHVDTQRNLGELGKPDLVIETGSVCIFIECKITDYRELTPNQPVSYLNYLDTLTGKQGALVFLIPYYYEHEALIGKRAATADSRIQPKIIYWNKLLERLEQTGIAGQNVAIEHFVALLHAWFDIKRILFTEEDMKLLQDKEFPAQLVKLTELITEVGNKFPKSFKPEADHDESSIGYSVKDKNGQYILWFGCSFEFWRDHGSFFQVGVGVDEDQVFSQAVIDRFRGKFGEDTWYEPWQWYIAPVPLPLIEDPQNVKKIARYIADAAAFCGGAEETP